LNAPQARGLSIDDVETKVADFFGGINQQDIAADPTLGANLTQSEKIQLLIDKHISGGFGGSPWVVGQVLDGSVANQIHAQGGSTLVFQIDAAFFDGITDKVLPARYALVWDDSIIATQGTLDIQVIGQTFLIVTVPNEPTGQVLTLWLDDQFARAHLIKTGTLADAGNLQKQINGSPGVSGQNPNPVSDFLTTVQTFFVTSQVGGLVALAIVGVVLVFVVRSETFKDIAKTAVKTAKAA
jgi:hypothetical protein